MSDAGLAVQIEQQGAVAAADEERAADCGVGPGRRADAAGQALGGLGGVRRGWSSRHGGRRASEDAEALEHRGHGSPVRNASRVWFSPVTFSMGLPSTACSWRAAGS